MLSVQTQGTTEWAKALCTPADSYVEIHRMLISAIGRASKRVDRDNHFNNRFGRTVLIPQSEGSQAIILSDLERFDRLHHLLEREEVLERMKNGFVNAQQENSPTKIKNQQYIIVLGDFTDDTPNARQNIEALLRLQSGEAFYARPTSEQQDYFNSRIIIISGNHEEFTSSRLDEDGFLNEIQKINCIIKEEDRHYFFTNPVEGYSLADALHWKKKLLDKVWPDNNHEAELIKKIIFYTFHQWFDELPLTILTGNGVFMSHSGIPIDGLFDPLNEQPTYEDAFHDLTCGDLEGEKLFPYRDEFVDDKGKSSVIEGSESVSRLDAIRWGDFYPNTRGIQWNGHRNRGDIYGHEVLNRFLNIFHCSARIGGHQSQLPSGAQYVDSEKKGAWYSVRDGFSAITINTAIKGTHILLNLSKPHPTLGEDLAKDGIVAKWI